MAVQFPIPEGLDQTWGGARSWLTDMLGNIFDPNRQTQPPAFQGMQAPPQSLPQLMAGMIMEQTPAQALQSGMIGMGPMPLDVMTKAIKSGRAGGAFKNRTTKVSQFIENNIPKEHNILDFGAGYNAIQTKKLRDKGYNVTAYDLPENMQVGIHNPDALNKQYDTVMASNVLNVQPSVEKLIDMLASLKNTMSPTGQIIANYPKSPRYGNLTDTDMFKILQENFKVDKLKDIFILKGK